MSTLPSVTLQHYLRFQGIINFFIFNWLFRRKVLAIVCWRKKQKVTEWLRKWLVPESVKHSYRCSKWIWIAHMLNELSNTLGCLAVGWKMRRLRTAVVPDAEMEWGGYAGDGSAHMHIYHWWQTRASVKNAYLWLWIPTELISFTDLNALKMSKQINKSQKNQISVMDWMPFEKWHTYMWMLIQTLSPRGKDFLCYNILYILSYINWRMNIRPNQTYTLINFTIIL